MKDKKKGKQGKKNKKRDKLRGGKGCHFHSHLSVSLEKDAPPSRKSIFFLGFFFGKPVLLRNHPHGRNA